MGDTSQNVCCHSYPLMTQRLQGDMKCITETRGFDGNCLNADVLEVSAYDFVAMEGRLGDDEPENELLRHLAYRRLVRWIFGVIGRHNRKVLPACAVSLIRRTFPEAPPRTYTGFLHSVY